MSKIIQAVSDEDRLMAVCEELRTEHQLETYDDFAAMCKKMAEAVDFMRYYNNAPVDHEEKMNLEYLESMLMTCSKMFINCDSYYRS